MKDIENINKYSFIIKENSDFMRDNNGKPIIIDCNNIEEAEFWFNSNSKWWGLNTDDIIYYNWNSEPNNLLVKIKEPENLNFKQLEKSFGLNKNSKD